MIYTRWFYKFNAFGQLEMISVDEHFAPIGCYGPFDTKEEALLNAEQEANRLLDHWTYALAEVQSQKRAFYKWVKQKLKKARGNKT